MLENDIKGNALCYYLLCHILTQKQADVKSRHLLYICYKKYKIFASLIWIHAHALYHTPCITPFITPLYHSFLEHLSIFHAECLGGFLQGWRRHQCYDMKWYWSIASFSIMRINLQHKLWSYIIFSELMQWIIKLDLKTISAFLHQFWQAF